MPTNPLTAATLAARTRLGEPRISVAVRAGRFQIQMITMGRKTTVEALTEWLDGPTTVATLGTLTLPTP